LETFPDNGGSVWSAGVRKAAVTDLLFTQDFPDPVGVSFGIGFRVRSEGLRSIENDAATALRPSWVEDMGECRGPSMSAMSALFRLKNDIA